MERKSHNSKFSEFDTLYSLISYRGDSDLILDGIHENILQLNYHDPVMQKTVKCLNSLEVYDLLHQYIMRTQQMPLLVHLPPIAIIVHHTVAQVQKPNIEWPKSYHRYRTTMMEKMDILNTWHYKISPHIARHLSPTSFVEDLISPLLDILSPPTIKPVALQLLSDKEKNDIAQLVSTMVSYAITYKKMKSDALPNTLKYEVADELSLSLVPSIGNFVNFKDYTSNHYVLSLAMKQVLVHEVEKHKILQANTKTATLANGGHEVNEAENNILANTKNHAAVVDMKTIQSQTNVLARKSNEYPKTVSPNMNPTKIAYATDNAKLLDMGNKKKPSRSSLSFFD
ncbi:chromosome transmission fidelity protein, partial [Trifolium pratense]